MLKIGLELKNTDELTKEEISTLGSLIGFRSKKNLRKVGDKKLFKAYYNTVSFWGSEKRFDRLIELGLVRTKLCTRMNDYTITVKGLKALEDALKITIEQAW